MEFLCKKAKRQYMRISTKRGVPTLHLTKEVGKEKILKSLQRKGCGKETSRIHQRAVLNNISTNKGRSLTEIKICHHKLSPQLVENLQL